MDSGRRVSGTDEKAGPQRRKDVLLIFVFFKRIRE